MSEETHEVSVSFVRRYTMVEHTCPQCGAVFTGPRLRVYCSARCRKQAAWDRIGPEMNARRNEKRKAARNGGENKA
jgi:predicted RNA-binding Zn-ribbon protein involved in translation (DUF1610 family)